MKIKNKYINFFGWILFAVSAIGFCIASIGSFWSMFGSSFFLVGCLVFFIPFFRKEEKEQSNTNWNFYEVFVNLRTWSKSVKNMRTKNGKKSVNKGRVNYLSKEQGEYILRKVL